MKRKWPLSTNKSISLKTSIKPSYKLKREVSKVVDQIDYTFKESLAL